MIVAVAVSQKQPVIIYTEKYKSEQYILYIHLPSRLSPDVTKGLSDV